MLHSVECDYLTIILNTSFVSWNLCHISYLQHQRTQQKQLHDGLEFELNVISVLDIVIIYDSNAHLVFLK